MSVAIHNFSRLRALALGPGIVDFCNRTAPDLMRRYDKAASQFDVLQAELEKELNDLRDELHEGTRSEALAAALVMSERLMGLLEKQIAAQHKLTGGGAAAVWVGMARLPSENGQAEDTLERDVTPRRRLGSGAQVIDA
jgi:hypothetical protein